MVRGGTRCLRRLLLVMGRIPLQIRHLRHILGQERRLGHKSLPRKGLAPPTNSEGSKHPRRQDPGLMLCVYCTVL